MEIKLENKDGLCTALVTGEMNIYHALDLKKGVMEALASPEPLQIDLSGAAELDTTGLQLLLLAKREAEASGRAFSIVNASEAAASVIDLFSVGEYLNCSADHNR